MKKIIIFLSLFSIVLLLSKCEKDFEPKIYGELFTRNFPKTQADYEADLMTLYIPFEVNWGYTMKGDYSDWQYNFYICQGVYRLFDLTSDYAAPHIDLAYSATVSKSFLLMSMANFSNDILFTRVNADDTPHYGKIRDVTRATQVIGTIQNATILSADVKNKFLGEARLLRGLEMYYLLHIYGPVPVIVDPSLVGTIAEENEVRPTLTQMVQYITDDLEFAAANMAETVTTKGRYTADYARFCLMRHYLNEGSYMTDYYTKAIALYTTLNSHGYGLFTTGANPYVDQFRNANKFNNEVIMSVSCGVGGNGDGKSGNFNSFSWYTTPNDAAKYADVGNTIPTPFVNQGSGWGQHFQVAPAYYDTYEPGDLRKAIILTSYVKDDAAKTLITPADIGDKWWGYIIYKFPIETTDAFQWEDIPLARWADVLLMYAEAVARNTQAVPSGDALQAVNDVRARAGLPALSGAAIASYNGFMDALLAERGHEFLYEGGRKIDLIRFNKYRHNCLLIKGIAPTSQYMPIPNYAVQEAASYGKTLEQWYERPDYSSDN